MLRKLARSLRLRGAWRPARSGADASRSAPDERAQWRDEREYWRDKLADWMRTHYQLPLHRLQEDDTTVPDPQLAAKIQNTSKGHPDIYFATGCRTALDYLRELNDHGFDPRRFERILEFGVGLGRLIRHFVPFACHRDGCDVTAEVVEFTRPMLAGHVQVARNDVLPPLPYGDCSFDFIYANSVFTHIQMAATPVWIAELRRVLKPGGVVIATVFEANRYLAHLSPRQFDECEYGSGYLEWGDAAVNQRFMYMTPHKLRETWSQAFEVLELRPRFREQSHLIVRRR